MSHTIRSVNVLVFRVAVISRRLQEQRATGKRRLTLSYQNLAYFSVAHLPLLKVKF